MAEIQGTCDDRFSQLTELLSNSIDADGDLGASIAINVGDELVVDIWGGWADPDKTKPWESDTITNVWSTTKTMTSLCALMLVDQGKLDVHEKVATYWPEFAANGKENIEVRHLMSHTSGVSGWAQPVVTEDIYDWEKSTAMLAAQEPWFEPGSGSGYHALNQGHLVGEVVRRIDGRTLGTFFAEEVAGPLGADFHIGLAAEHDARVSHVVPPPPDPMLDPSLIPQDSVAFKTFTGPGPSAEASWTTEWKRAEIGAANGHGNARSVVRAQSVIANGGEVDGIRLLSPETIELIFEEQSFGPDLVLGEPLRFGVGYGLSQIGQRMCYWGGWGGSVIMMDLDHNLTISYVMNKMDGSATGDPRGEAIVLAAYAALM